MTSPRSRYSRKPIDVGNALVAASFSPEGAWLSLSCYHPRHGTVELSGMPPFDEGGRDDPDAVRRYRGWMTDDRHAFLRLRTQHIAQHDIVVEAVPGLPTVEQRHDMLAASRETGHVTLVARGRIDRPALAEITEVTPLEPTRAVTIATPESKQLRLTAWQLRATATIEVATGSAVRGRWKTLGPDAAELDLRFTGRLELVVRSTLEAGEARKAHLARPAGGAPVRPDRLWMGRARLHASQGHRDALARIRLGALRYVRCCTALRVAPREVCFLADHRILPLSWTRDAYYQALLLLASGDPDAADLVEDHVRWLFGRCRRADAMWHRSHLANGEPKDRAFQADQQLYPLLELCDYRAAIGAQPEAPDGKGWSTLVCEVWRSLPSSEDGLLPTDENPADDAARFPYTLSTQILVWYLATRLAELEDELDLRPLALAETAHRLRASILRLFRQPGPYGDQWAYEIDADGRGHLYADANDLPTAFAPVWGFCGADDPVWQATMRFAFSEHNPAYAPGRLGGLGSLHTPGTWPLGDIQEWIVASLCEDDAHAEAALDRLAIVSADDGLLPEAYDSNTGAWRARHWFAWPAAILGALALAATTQ